MTGKKENRKPVEDGLNVGRLFSKEQLLAAERFQGRKDIVNALLSPDKEYTVEAVEQMIEKYMKGQVK